MAQISHVLARLKRDPIADLPIAAPGATAAPARPCLARPPPHAAGHRTAVSRADPQRQCFHRCAAAAVGIDFAPSSYSEARDRLPFMYCNTYCNGCRSRRRKPLDAVTNRPAGFHRRWLQSTPWRTRPAAPRAFQPAQGNHARRRLSRWASSWACSTRPLECSSACWRCRCFSMTCARSISAHPMLRPGDILLGDRAFCSFCHLAILERPRRVRVRARCIIAARPTPVESIAGTNPH